jgi:RimJ/RimL family protein N-acetyltransferase
MTKIEIETDRLILRQPNIDDAIEVNGAINEMWHDLQLWMSWAFDGMNTLEATRDFITEFCVEQGRRGGLQLLGFDKDTGKFVVATGLTVTDETGDNEYTTGYWVAKDFLGKGYATEATKAVLKYAFNGHRAQRMLIDYYEDNEKSRPIIEKCGFTFVRTDAQSHGRCLDGEMMDTHVYEMKSADHLRDFDVRWGAPAP